MKCPKCGFDHEDGSVFCGSCGEDLSSLNIMNTLDENARATEMRSKKKKIKTDVQSSGEKAAKLKKIKIISVIVLILAVSAAIAIAVLMNLPTTGEKVLENVPIGRDLAYAEAKTGREFSAVSDYNAMKSLGKYDYICEEDTAVKVEGINFPEWAINVSLANDKTINRVTYYDFTQLRSGWKGHKSSSEIDQTVIEYGMKRKAVDRALGFAPYIIIKDVDNTVTTIHRYHFADDLTGDDVVCNFCVVFNDIDESVKNVYVNEIDYINFLVSN